MSAHVNGAPSQAVIVSGKGGTGKTTVAGAFAAVAEGVVWADADVDASNLPLLMAPEIREEHVFASRGPARVDPAKCGGCKLCATLCRFGAVSLETSSEGDARAKIDPLRCEGCNLCVRSCPRDAIVPTRDERGRWYVSDTNYGPLVHARLAAAQENSGRLVTLVRQRAEEIARVSGRKRILVDGPPGIGCPAIASLSGASVALIVAEPSVSSLHDMRRVMALADRFGVKIGVAVNKADLDRNQARGIVEEARREGAEFLGEIPFDPAVPASIREGRPLIEAHPESPAGRATLDLWARFSSFWAGVAKETF